MNKKSVLFSALVLLIVFLMSALVSLVFDNSIMELKQGRYESAKPKIEVLAAMGHAKSQLELGEMYAYGLGVVRDRNEAIKWFRRAESNEHSVACIAYHVGTHFLELENSKDVSEAAWWLQIAKKGGCADGR